ncbi:MAG: hypothetical protein HY800_04745, partial [Ignavibacteriales bacterium]|nr:hypothetical protein [Ignavibacteriales bacterium]
MKSIASILIIFFASVTIFADQPDKLGKFLMKHYASMKDNDQAVVYISFTDKGDTKKLSTFNASSLVSERSLNRRLKVRGLNNVVDENDLPLERSYVSAVSNHVVKVRHELKWFNALSVIATKRQINLIKDVPFVKEIELVGRWKASPVKETP